MEGRLMPLWHRPLECDLIEAPKLARGRDSDSSRLVPSNGIYQLTPDLGANDARSKNTITFIFLGSMNDIDFLR